MKFEIGMPVYLKIHGKVLSNWVGYVNRINARDKLIEYGPEVTPFGHLSVRGMAEFAKGKFTKYRHPKLQAHITRLRAMKFDDTGKVIRHQTTGDSANE